MFSILILEIRENIPYFRAQESANMKCSFIAMEIHGKCFIDCSFFVVKDYQSERLKLLLKNTEVRFLTGQTIQNQVEVSFTLGKIAFPNLETINGSEINQKVKQHWLEHHINLLVNLEAFAHFYMWPLDSQLDWLYITKQSIPQQSN